MNSSKGKENSSRAKELAREKSAPPESLEQAACELAAEIMRYVDEYLDSVMHSTARINYAAYRDIRGLAEAAFVRQRESQELAETLQPPKTAEQLEGVVRHLEKRLKWTQQQYETAHEKWQATEQRLAELGQPSPTIEEMSGLLSSEFCEAAMAELCEKKPTFEEFWGAKSNLSMAEAVKEYELATPSAPSEPSVVNEVLCFLQWSAQDARNTNTEKANELFAKLAGAGSPTGAGEWMSVESSQPDDGQFVDARGWWDEDELRVTHWKPLSNHSPAAPPSSSSTRTTDLARPAAYCLKCWDEHQPAFCPERPREASSTWTTLDGEK